MKLIFELNYRDLPADLKQCFQYCDMFPKNYNEIQKDDQLVLRWRGQGFIQPNGNNNFMDNEKNFMELLSSSFFQEVTTNYLGNIREMHDLTQGFAGLITDKECIHGRIVNKRIHRKEYYCKEVVEKVFNTKTTLRTLFRRNEPAVSSYRRDCNDRMCHNLLTLMLELDLSKSSVEVVKYFSTLRDVRYLSIRVNESIEYLPNSITKFHLLETLILRGCKYLKELPKDIKNWMNLKYFDLSCNVKMEFLPNSITELLMLETLILKGWKELKKLPMNIKKLKNLRHLDISSNTNIEFLPDHITELYNLETLVLDSCSRLKELPRDTKYLIKLKHLDLNGCTSLTRMPRGLGELTNLQTMNLFVVGDQDNDSEYLDELHGLENLRGSLTLKGVQFCTTIDVGENAKFLQRKSGLRELKLYWTIGASNQRRIDNYENVLDCFQPHSNLQEILIYGYNGVKLCDWVSSNYVGRLISIKLSSCRKLEHLPHFDKLPYLKHLHLENLQCIDYIIDDNDDFVVFPSLEELSIDKLPKLKRWWKISGSASQQNSALFPIIFPCLSELKISGSLSHPINMDEYDVPLECFKSLTSLTLCHISKFESMSKYLQHVTTSTTTLQHLSLKFCLDLTSLPEWIGNHNQLSKLWIDSCPKLRSLPKSIANLSSLTELKICSCEELISLPKGIRSLLRLQSLKIWWCPRLKQRCKKQDWHNISHIQDIDFEDPTGLN